MWLPPGHAFHRRTKHRKSLEELAKPSEFSASPSSRTAVVRRLRDLGIDLTLLPPGVSRKYDLHVGSMVILLVFVSSRVCDVQ